MIKHKTTSVANAIEIRSWSITSHR